MSMGCSILGIKRVIEPVQGNGMRGAWNKNVQLVRQEPATTVEHSVVVRAQTDHVPDEVRATIAKCVDVGGVGDRTRRRAQANPAALAGEVVV